MRVYTRAPSCVYRVSMSVVVCTPIFPTHLLLTYSLSHALLESWRCSRGEGVLLRWGGGTLARSVY
jgi:hypothetical protein